MKAGTARSILKSLHGQRLDAFMAVVGRGRDGKKLQKVCKFIHAATDPAEVEVMRACDLTRGQYLHALEGIAEALVLFITLDGKLAYLGQCAEFIRSLIAALDHEAATDLLHSAMQEAIATEEFSHILTFWKLAATIDPLPSLQGMAEDRAELLDENLRAYERLLRIYKRLRLIPNVVEKRLAMKDLIKHPLLKGPKEAFSHRATYHYLKLKSAILVHLRQHRDALELQSQLVAHLEAHPWISEIKGLAIVQEMNFLAKSYYLTGNLEQYHAIARRINDLSSPNPQVDLQRIRFLYPVRIGIAIESGNASETESAIHGFLSILETSESLMDKQLITRNLYTCFYGAIAMGSKELRRTLNRLLSKHRKADFHPRYYTMYRLLEVINAMEEMEWEDARRLIINRTKRPEEEVIPKAAEAFRFLAYLTTLMEPLAPGKRPTFPDELRQLLAALIHGSIFSDYFDLEAWVESKERGCSMLSIFRDRASTLPDKA